MKKILNKIIALLSALAFPTALMASVALFGYFYSISDDIPSQTSSMQKYIEKVNISNHQKEGKASIDETLTTANKDKIIQKESVTEEPKEKTKEELNLFLDIKESIQSNILEETQKPPSADETNYSKKNQLTQTTIPKEPILKETGSLKAINTESENNNYSKDIERLLELETSIPIEVLK